jgi:hypothetical protein
LDRLVGLWQRINRWMRREQLSHIYHRSNLHGRHR